MQLNQMMRHDRQHIGLKWQVVFATVSLDAHEIRDQSGSVRRDLFGDRLLFFGSKAIKVLASNIPLVTNVVFDAGDVDTHRADR